MLIRDKETVTVLGFARYETRDGVATEEVIAAALRWQEEFLAAQPGIAFHAFMGNGEGRYADAILARDEAAFAEMARRHPETESGLAFMGLLKPETISLCQSVILKDGVAPPETCGAIEFGTFALASGSDATLETVRRRSTQIDDAYLSGERAVAAHFVTRIDDTRFCEVSFGRSVGELRRLCNGYVGHPDCQPFLDLMAAESVDLDFWHVLA